MEKSCSQIAVTIAPYQARNRKRRPKIPDIGKGKTGKPSKERIMEEKKSTAENIRAKTPTERGALWGKKRRMNMTKSDVGENRELTSLHQPIAESDVNREFECKNIFREMLIVFKFYE